MNCPRCGHKFHHFSDSLDNTQDWLCLNCDSSLTVIAGEDDFFTSIWIDGRAPSE